MSFFGLPKIISHPKDGILKVKIYDKETYDINNIFHYSEFGYDQNNNTKYESSPNSEGQNSYLNNKSLDLSEKYVGPKGERGPPGSILHSNYLFQMRSNINIPETGTFLGPNGISEYFDDVCSVSPSMGLLNRMTLSIGQNMINNSISRPNSKNPVETYVVMLPYDGNNYGKKIITLTTINSFLEEWVSKKGILKTSDMTAVAGGSSVVPTGTKIGLKMVLKNSLSVTEELGALIVRPGDLFAIWIRPVGKNKFSGFKAISSLLLEVM